MWVPDIITVSLILAFSITLTLLLHYLVQGWKKDEEINRLWKLLKTHNDAVFYAVHFQGKNLQFINDKLSETTYRVKWKKMTYNGTFNSMMIENKNGLDPKTWYVLQIRTAYDVWNDKMRESD